MGEYFRGWRRKGDLLRVGLALTVMGGLLLKAGASSLQLLSAWAFLASPLIAMRKGYAPYCWPLACGPIGLVAIISLAPLKSAKNPEEYERLEKRANFIGAFLSWIGVLIVLTIVASIGLSNFV